MIVRAAKAQGVPLPASVGMLRPQYWCQQVSGDKPLFWSMLAIQGLVTLNKLISIFIQRLFYIFIMSVNPRSPSIFSEIKLALASGKYYKQQTCGATKAVFCCHNELRVNLEPQTCYKSCHHCQAALGLVTLARWSERETVPLLIFIVG